MNQMHKQRFMFNNVYHSIIYMTKNVRRAFISVSREWLKNYGTGI